ncbi:Lipoprotein [Chromobacterium violaceum]|uniref:hypothetical protein n=1 Tax=Chromobacterium violaceum TaxID=536 RepID=UPI001B319E5E|nr:hypothetical protein [Chromobacterium violaceum]MBP4047629.1 hypothetical protein [Chromobacterium violaceum]
MPKWKTAFSKAAAVAWTASACGLLAACWPGASERINRQAEELGRALPQEGSQYWQYYGLTVVQQQLTLAANGYYAWETVSDDGGAPPGDHDYGRWREEDGQLVLASQFGGERRLQAGCRDGEFVWLYGYPDEEPAWHGDTARPCPDGKRQAKTEKPLAFR